MSIETARIIIDDIFNYVSNNSDDIVINFIGGEPLLEFELIKEIVAYTHSKEKRNKYVFFAASNGTILTQEIREWLTKHRSQFILGLSIDGAKKTHDYNRSNSFCKIDIDFFLKNWPEQGVKMTLSEYSLPYLAENIKYIHSCGFKGIGGVNLAEGEFDWSKEEYIKVLIPQLKELVKFYVDNDTLFLNQMFDRHLNFCEANNKDKRKWCGIGTGCPFYDTDGKMYPCPYITPMTFSEDEIADILEKDFTNDELFIDDECFSNCYIYRICPTCSGANYLNNKTFKKRDKSKCKIQKLIALFIADLQAKRIAKNPKIYDDITLYHTIEAIKKIRDLYLSEFKEYLV